MMTQRHSISSLRPIIACCAIVIVVLIAAVSPSGCAAAAAAAPIFTADSLHAAADAHAAQLMRSRSAHSATSASASVSSSLPSSRFTHSESVAFVAVPAASPSSSSTSSPYVATIASALTLVSRSEQNVSTPFFPPFSLQKLADVFPSFIHFNLVGGPLNSTLRNILAIFDNNGFITNWIVQLQLECMRLGALQVADDTLLRGVNLTNTFKEHLDPADVGTTDFWQESFINGSWQQFPQNVAEPIELALPVAQMLQGWCDKKPALCPTVEPFIAFAENLQDYLSSFGIPADFDDSSVNLALGSLLSSLQETVPKSWDSWSSSTGNVSPTALMSKYTTYAYRPFSTDFNQNSIDVRTYYWLRNFIYEHEAQAKKNGVQPNLMLITTWIDNISGSDKNYYGHHKMPFLTNNVDGSVVGNSVFGIISSILMHAPLDGSGDYLEFVTADLLQLLGDSADLLAWVFNEQLLLTRNDLVLLYYPPVHNCFYFASRTVRALQSVAGGIEDLFAGVYGDPATAAALATIRDTLTSALRNQGTATMIAQSQRGGGSGGGAAGQVWWDEFLGDDDTDSKGNPAPLHEDRLFTTAMALNALMASWATQSSTSGALSWATTATPMPPQLMTTISGACAFLDAELVAGSFAPANAFFSGSVKGPTTLPFNYPTNSWRYINGSTVPWQQVTWDIIGDDLGVSFSGVVTESEYQYMLQNNPLGVQAPTVFQGYNIDGNGMVFWSSPALTYAVGMLALAQCAALNVTNAAAAL